MGTSGGKVRATESLTIPGLRERAFRKAVTGHLANGTRFLSGFLIPRFGGWSDIRRFTQLVISEQSECFDALCNCIRHRSKAF